MVRAAPRRPAAGSVNDCANIPARPGANPASRQCATLTLERLSLHSCTGSLHAMLIDNTPAVPPAGSGCGAGQVALVAIIDNEVPGAVQCLSSSGGGLYEGEIRISALSDQRGVLFTGPTGSASRRLVVSYQDEECDQDGDGDLGENDALDLDGDGVSNVTDLCFSGATSSDVFNAPGQPQRDNDGSGTVTAADCPIVGAPHGRSPITGQCDWDADDRGDLCDNCPAFYNPAQADTDDDGVGNDCEITDLDGDTIPNGSDNCPTLYNPPDPLTGSQTDSDGDGRGDDRTGIDTQPGVQDYCDPGSDDDAGNGLPDDLLQVAAALDCDFSSQGTGRVTGLAPSTASMAVSAVAMTDDGTADFLCTAGDPIPLNDPSVPEPCPQETPGGGSQDAACDTPGMPGSGICAAVPDGIADPGETATLRLTLTNMTIDPRSGVGMALTNLAVGIRPRSEVVGCVPKSHVFVGTLGAGGTIVTPTGALSFIVDPQPAGPGQWAFPLPQPEALFELTATADGIEGLVSPPTFRFSADLDMAEAPPIPGACSENILINGRGVLCEGFDTDRNNDGNFDLTRLPIGASATDPLRALGDPGDDVLGYTQDTGQSPSGTAGRTCANYIGRPNCEAPIAEENDWHLHSPFEGPGAGYDPPNRPGIGAPDGGKAHRGFRSMHMGRHLSPTATFQDTTRYRQVSAFVLDSQGDTNDGLVLGTGTTMEFWHLIQTIDASDGFLPPGGTFGGGQVQVSLLSLDGKFERWRRLTPTVNGYDAIINSTISICEFDPGDDEWPPANETMRRSGSPLWGDIGDVYGADPTCLTDTDGNDAAHKDCGATTHQGPANIQIGSRGPGVWARSAFDLSPLGGRVARLRWIFMEGGGWSFGITRSALEPQPGNSIYQYFDGDDGWWIDDIMLTDLRQAPATMLPDPLNGLSTCPAGPDVDACGVISISVAGTPLFSDTPGQPVTINLLPSSAGDDPGTTITVEAGCANGMLLHQISEIDEAGAVTDIIQASSPAAVAKVAPWRDTTYRIETHCSSDPDCTAAVDLVVKVYPGDGSDLDLDATGGTTTTLAWLARPQPTGISGYDLFRLTSGPLAGSDPWSGGTFDGSCFKNAVVQAQVGTLISTSDAAIPALNTAFFYQLGHSSAAAGALAPLGFGSPSSSHAGQLMTAGVACP